MGSNKTQIDDLFQMEFSPTTLPPDKKEKQGTSDRYRNSPQKTPIFRSWNYRPVNQAKRGVKDHFHNVYDIILCIRTTVSGYVRSSMGRYVLSGYGIGDHAKS